MATITPLFSGGGAGSSFDPLAFDITRDKKAGARLLRRGDVLAHDTFDDGGFQGWRDHFAYATPRSVVGLTEYPVVRGKKALMLSTGEGEFDAASQWNSTGTYKNMALLGDWDLVSFSGFFMLAGGGELNEWKFPWSTFEVGFDMQWPDSTKRAFFKVYLKDGIGGVPGSTAWMIRSSETTDQMIPGSQKIFTGGNERKWNWMYVRLTVSRSANGGLGGYVELQVNDTIFDLQSMFGTVLVKDTLLDTGSWNHFAYGFNTMIATTRSTLNPGLRSNVVVADELVTTVNDRRAA